MRNKKGMWIVLLIAGIIPFVIPLIGGLDAFINGYSGFCFNDCSFDYGFSALKSSILIYSWLLWPTYIIGVVLIVLSIIKLRHKKK